MTELISTKHWIYVIADLGIMLPMGREIGQWCIFVSESDRDHIWCEIVRSLESGLLWKYARISIDIDKTKNENQKTNASSTSVICVYTYNVKHVSNLMKIRRELRKIGVTQSIGYISKKNIDAGVAKWIYKDETLLAPQNIIPDPPLWLLQKDRNIN